VVVNGDITSFADATQALSESGAAAVMIGRAALGRPWLPGQVADYLRAGERPRTPALDMQKALLLELYEGILLHYGTEVGLRHARKHLRAALDVATDTAGLAPESIEERRSAVLTAESTRDATHRLEEAFDAIAWRMAA
jgi:tRNA-dihydrouridine synthase